MGKMINALILAVSIQLALILFTGAPVPVEGYTNGSTLGVGAYGNISTSSFNQLIYNPTLWETLPLIVFIISLASIGGLIVGTFWVRIDLLIRATLVGAMVGFMFPIVQLWIFLASQPSMYCAATDIVGTTCSYGQPTAYLIATLFCFPLSIYFIITLLDWWSSRD